MTWITVWVLVSVSNNYALTYSPPVRSQSECIALKDVLKHRLAREAFGDRFQCVQMQQKIG